MSNAPAYNVFDGDPNNAVVPRRPSLEDVGGAHLVNYDEPIPETMPAAEDLNQLEMLVPRLGAVIGAAVISVHFNAGDPVVTGVQALGTTITAASFTPTDNADGDTSLTWSGTAFPLSNVHHYGLTINSDTDVDRIRAITIENGVRVKTFLGATPTDADFTIVIAGMIVP